MTYIPLHKKRIRRDSGDVKLQLTSMMDMFTIILVFLLKTYSTQGQLINPSQNLTLPVSKTQHPPEVGLDVTVSTQRILVNGKSVEQIETIAEQGQYLIPKLQKELLKYANQAEAMEKIYGVKFSGKVTIQGDKRLPYRYLMKVMYTCAQSKYPNMRFVVYTEE
jgi:biopolymer transport protein ExbD